MVFEDSDEKTSPSGRLKDHSAPWMLCALLNPFKSCLTFQPTPTVLYRSLPSPNSIRLLQIHPGKPGADLNCGLKLALFGSNLPSYEALSYVWGSTAGQKEIVLNGFPKKVNANLYEGLQRLRKKHGTRTIWVDALCINQDDGHEKGHQVGLMSHIYARATTVLVWLGTDDYQEAERAFEILRAAADTHDKSKKEEKSWGLVIPQLSNKTKRNRMQTLPPLGSELWVPVMALFTNIWFVRMWVLQEIVLARTAVFIWGPFQLDWKIIESAISIITSDAKLYAKLESRELQNAAFMSHLRKIRLDAMESAHPFLHLLDVARTFDVTEAEDKVYGLLGFPISSPSFSDSSSRIFIEPDYSSSIASIYTSVALKLISQSGNLDVLSFAVHTSDEEDKKEGPQKGRYEKKTNEQEKIPSWVPNWNLKMIVYPFAGFHPKIRHSTSTHRPLHIQPPSTTGTLSVKGLRLDTVAEVCAPVPYKNIEELGSEVNRLVRWCLERQTNLTQTISSPPPPPLFTETSLASVLTGGRQSTGALVTDPAQHRLDFIDYLSRTLLDLDVRAHVERKEAEDNGKVSGRFHGSASQNSSELYRDEAPDKNPTTNTDVELARQNKPATKPTIPTHTPPSKAPVSNPSAAREAIFKTTCHRSLFTTSCGRLGLGPGATRGGDVVVALWGAQVPFVVREDEGGWCELVGECYVDRFMGGGEVERVVEDGGVEEVFELR